MDPELRQHLEAMEARLSAGFRADLEQAKVEVREQLEQAKVEVREQLEQVRAESREDLERVETRLLTEFHKWASPLDARMRTHTATLRALDLEMEALNDRLKKLEPPAA